MASRSEVAKKGAATRASNKAAIERGAAQRTQARRPSSTVNLTGTAFAEGRGYGRPSLDSKRQANLGGLLKSLAKLESPEAEASYRTNVKPEIARLDATLDILGQQLAGATREKRAKLRAELARLAAERKTRYSSLYAAELKAVRAEHAKYAKVPRQANRERAKKMAESYLVNALRAGDEATRAAYRHWESLPRPLDFHGDERTAATTAKAHAWDRVQDAVVAWAKAEGKSHTVSKYRL